MIFIDDRDSKTGLLPVWALLDAVLRHTEIESTTLIRLEMFGGPGDRIWQLESRLDAGESVVLPMAHLMEIAFDSTQFIDEMRCIYQQFCFGLFDASYLYFQSLDRNIEDEVAAEFLITGKCADLK